MHVQQSCAVKEYCFILWWAPEHKNNATMGIGSCYKRAGLSPSSFCPDPLGNRRELWCEMDDCSAIHRWERRRLYCFTMSPFFRMICRCHGASFVSSYPKVRSFSCSCFSSDSLSIFARSSSFLQVHKTRRGINFCLLDMFAALLVQTACNLSSINTVEWQWTWSTWSMELQQSTFLFPWVNILPLGGNIKTGDTIDSTQQYSRPVITI